MRGLVFIAALTLACDASPPDRPAAADLAFVDSGFVDSASAGPVSTEPLPADPAPGETAPAAFLDGYDFEERLRRADLPGALDEVSGLAFTPDGRLFAHDDERGRIHEVDPVTLEVGKRFDLGSELARDDFEGIAVVGERFFLVSSTGLLYEFREGADRDDVAYRRTDTGVGAGCEVEGLDYEPVRAELLLACKTSDEPGLIVVHRLPVEPDRARPPPLRVREAALRAFGLEAEYAPSAIAVAPTGSWLLLSARQNALIEVDPEAGLLAAVRLSEGRHPQAEGLAIGPDGTLFVADERNGKDPRVTAYGPR